MTKPSAPYILWLPSWYPNKLAPFNGDFIQRHARAAALYNDIHVIHAIETEKIDKTTSETSRSPGLTEQIIYIKRKKSPWGRMRGHYQWLTMSRQAIRDHIKANGVPDAVHVNIP